MGNFDHDQSVACYRFNTRTTYFYAIGKGIAAGTKSLRTDG